MLNYINAYQQIPVPYGSMLHIPTTNLLLLAAKQEPYQKRRLSLHEKILKEFSGKKFRRMDSRQKKKEKKKKEKKKDRKSNRTR